MTSSPTTPGSARTSILRIFEELAPEETQKSTSNLPTPLREDATLQLSPLVPGSLDQWTIYEQARYAPPPGWEEVFEEADAALRQITLNLSGAGPWYPAVRDVFKAFRLTPLANVRVVIVGQDPYPQEFQGEARAIGVSFGVRRGDDVPGSLRNVYMEIARNYPGYEVPTHGDLTAWTERGILLLNRCLTIEPGKPNSHKRMGWRSFINIVIKAIVEKRPDAIFLLWGNDAKELGRILPERVKRLEAAHPSNMSNRLGFTGCGHFREVNRIITAQHRIYINWLLDQLELNLREISAREQRPTQSVIPYKALVDDCDFGDLVLAITPLLQNDELSQAIVAWAHSAQKFCIDWSLPP